MMSDAIAALDHAVFHGVVRLAHGIAGGSLPALNWAARLLVEVDALKVGVPTLLAMRAWVHPRTGCRADPLRALRGAAGVIAALALARAAQELLPARPRPRAVLPEFPFPPLGHLDDLADWSSMPSDTAALTFALATVAWASSRRLGAVAFAWAAVVACLPRLYFGYHYLSDLVVGAALGVVSVAAALSAPLPAGAGARAEAALRGLDARAPAVLPLAFFVLGAECVQMFEFTRRMGTAAGELAQAFAPGPGDVGSFPPAPDAETGEDRGPARSTSEAAP